MGALCNLALYPGSCDAAHAGKSLGMKQSHCTIEVKATISTLMVSWVWRVPI